jgi:hypothetical protein
MGLDPFNEPMDNVDGLVVWEDFQNGGPEHADPGIDYALFSLSYNSMSLNMHGLTESDVFFTNFTGSFWLYAQAADMGLAGQPGEEVGDNVDALEILVPGDADLNGTVGFPDFTILAANYGGPGRWRDGDFSGNNLVDFPDFTTLAANYGGFSSPPPQSQSSEQQGSNGSAVTLVVDTATGQMSLVGGPANLSGYSISSAAGCLIPDADGDADPFMFYLSNTSNLVDAGNEGSTVAMPPDIALDAMWTVGCARDLVFSFGLEGQSDPVSGEIIYEEAEVIPEPATLALLGLTAIGLMVRRHRHSG